MRQKSSADAECVRTALCLDIAYMKCNNTLIFKIGCPKFLDTVVIILCLHEM